MDTTQTQPPVVYLNGQYLPRVQAKVDIEDRGFLFADGVYEVLRYYWNKPLAMDLHQARLRHSLQAVRIDAGNLVEQLPAISDRLIALNGQPNASIYWQVTRGSAPRNHLIPPDITPTVMAIVYPAHDIALQSSPKAMTASIQPDLRWTRCDIKSLMLLANVLAKANAHDQGGDEAILHRDGVITEGSSTSVLAVRQGELWTHPANERILDSITRKIILQLARQRGMVVHETALTNRELLDADEIMIAGTTTHLASVTQVDNQTIGAGVPGPVACELYTALMTEITHQCPMK